MNICMIVPDSMVKGGIASVVNGYRSRGFGSGYEIAYVESYCDGTKWDKLLKALRGYFDFARKIRKTRPDIVHIHSSFGPSFYRKMPFIYMDVAKGIPVINHIHGADFETFYSKASDRKKKLIRKVYGKCDKLIALSDEWKENLKQIVPEDRIAVIENYCVIPKVAGSNVTETHREIKILFLGEIGMRKGGFDIPLILSEVYEKEKNFHVIMAGDGTLEDVSRVKDMIEKSGLTDRVEFPGWVRGEEKDRLLTESDILLLPSYNEGMPMTILEAMAYGKAIVTTNVGGIPRLIENNVSGYLCEPGDVSGLAECILKLIRCPERILKFGEKAREKAVNSYSLEKHMEKLCTLYETVVQ
ncbi:MAG: glycosyltransferase family 4 protein [Eubacterium sp.]|nr:glycosyltransferase family 4 protein [Eubacterium sp.]